MRKIILSLIIIFGLTASSFSADVSITTVIPSAKIAEVIKAMDWKYPNDRGTMNNLEFARYLQTNEFWIALLRNYNEAQKRDKASIDAAEKTAIDTVGIN